MRLSARLTGFRPVVVVCACVAVAAAGLVAATREPNVPAQAATGVTFSNPGGDLTASVSDSSLSAAQATQALGLFEQGLGLSAGAGLSSVFQAMYNAMGGATPSVAAPPSFSGGTLTVSGDTFTADIPASDIPVSDSTLPGWLAGILGAIIGGLTALVVYAGCMAATFFTVGVLAAWMHPTCQAIAFFFWSFVGIIFFDWATGVPLDANTWETVLAYSIGSAALGAAFGYATRFISWFLPHYFGEAGAGIPGILADLAGWFGGAAQAAAAADVVLEDLGAAAGAANPVVVAGIAAQEGMAALQQTGTVTSGDAAFPGYCMDAYGTNGGASPGQIVAINTCNGNPAQNWSTWSDGAVSVFGLCLDTGGGAAPGGGTLTDLQFCDGASSQVWNQTGNTLVNQATGQCLDDTPVSRSGEPFIGTRLQTYPCNGSTTQEWILPVSLVK
jgi:Ricin-type beta-trefoil lectin domain